MRILVTDGDTRAALAITRSLGRRGHEVIVGGTNTDNLAGASRYASRSIAYPDPYRHVDKFVRYLAECVEFYTVHAIIPVTDITTLSICQHRDLIPDSCALPFPEYHTVRQAADKAAITELAASLDVDIPYTAILNTCQDLDTVSSSLRFPVVIKPARSRVNADQEWIYTSVSYAHTFDELKSILSEADPRIYPILLQEKIVGPGLGVSTYSHHGKTLAAFAHRRIREKPPSGGVSVVRESVPLVPIAYEFADKMLRALEWHGVAMVEFKIDERDKRPKLMEINGRFWGSLQLAIDAGVDFPRILIDSITKPPPNPILKYQTGVRTRWLWGDFDALLLRLLRRDSEQDLPPQAPTRSAQLIAFIRDFGNSTKHEIERRDDMGPAWCETRQWLKNTAGFTN